MNTMRKCNDEVYQLAKDQALVKKLKNKRFRPFCLCLQGVIYIYLVFTSALSIQYDYKPSSTSIHIKHHSLTVP